MTKYKAEISVDVLLEVEFEDDGETDIEELAYDAARDEMGFIEWNGMQIMHLEKIEEKNPA